MSDTTTPVPFGKPALASDTIRGALVTLLSSLVTIITVSAGALPLEALGPAITAAAGAAWSIWGRWRAAGPISGWFK